MHKLVRNLEIPSDFLKRHPITTTNQLNPWVNVESYAADVINSLFPPGRFPNLQRLDVVPCFYDAVAINGSSRIGGALDSNPYDLLPHPRVAGSCQPQRGHADVELFFVNLLLTRFPNLVSFGGVFELTVTDAYYPFAPAVRDAMKRTITSIKLNISKDFSVKDMEKQFEHKFKEMFPNLTHITLTNKSNKSIHYATKTIVDAVIRHFPSLKSLCLGCPNLYRFSSSNSGSSSVELKQLMADTLKDLLHLPSLECVNITGREDTKVVFLEPAAPNILYPNILSLIPTYTSTLTSLSLRSCGQHGDIPAGIFTLTQLVKLDLSFNKYGAPRVPQVVGDVNLPIPKKIGDLKNLRMLKLNDNMLGGVIPGSLYDLVELEHLHLDQNYLTGSLSRKVGQLTKLRIIRIEYRSASSLSTIYNTPGLQGAIPSSLGNCRDLIGLQIHGFFKGSIPKSLGNLTKLRCLEFSDPKLTRRIYSSGFLSSQWDRYNGPNIPRGWSDVCWDVFSKHLLFDSWESTQVQCFLAFLRGDKATMEDLLTTIKWGNDSGSLESREDEGSFYSWEDAENDEDSMADEVEEMEAEFLNTEEIVDDPGGSFHAVPDYVEKEVLKDSKVCLKYEQPYQTTGLTDDEEDDDDGDSYNPLQDPDLNLCSNAQINRWNPGIQRLPTTRHATQFLYHDVNSLDDEFMDNGFDENDVNYDSAPDSVDDDFKEGDLTPYVRILGGFLLSNNAEEEAFDF